MSNPKEMIFDEQAREKLREGIHQIASAVGITIGPKGRNVGLEAKWGAPSLTCDGYTIAKEIELKDQYLNMGASMAKEAAAKMKEACGDGTTTTILILNALVQEGVKNIASGASPIGLKRGIDKAVTAILEELTRSATPIKGESAIKNIATVSASGNEDIGKLIAEAIAKTGPGGVITVEEGKTLETVIEVVQGMQFDRGYLSPYFCTNVESMTSELSNAKLLITDKKISSVQELLPILQAVATAGQELLIIAEDLDKDALSTLVVNKLRGTIKVSAVKAPGFGDMRKAILKDIAVLTGATVVSDEMGMSLHEAGPEVLGEVEKVTISKDQTTLSGGKGDEAQIKKRVKSIEADIKKATSDYDKDKLNERKAKLSSGIAIIRVGAASEIEAKQKKQAFQDSLNSTRAALEEGIVPGGGVALLQACKNAVLKLTGDEKVGFELVVKACFAPFKQIVSCAGFDPSLMLEEVFTKGPGFGFNALTDRVEDLIESGIIDPAKVVKKALQLAASTAGIVLLSEVLIGNAS
jgi:chaperonin GroEL